MKARAIMVLGTSSHVGKSLLTAALCRIFAQEGYRVAPFKSQNMSLNSAVTPDGLEIGRAQALQAEAAGILPSVHMNPILLKPSGNMSSQVVVRGRIWGTLTASDYHRRRVEELLPIVRDSYQILAAKYEVIILEGAGSPAEINLKAHDIVNMRIAELADAACLLVGDIDRGGVFASLLGTVELLDPHERDRIRGFLINKFRGDIHLLEPGIRMMEERLGKPCMGVVPYLPELTIDEEDSLGLPAFGTNHDAAWSLSGDGARPLRIAVIALPSFSNFTDFDALRAEPSVSLHLCRNAAHLACADVVIIPGSKQTASDLEWMRDEGIASALLAHARRGLVTGICGGMQMLGHTILDPHRMEHTEGIAGLGLLAIHTTMRTRKTTRLSSGHLLAATLFGEKTPVLPISGYEIHIGETTYLEGAVPFAEFVSEHTTEKTLDGCVSEDGRVIGTYLHGIFDNDDFRHGFLSCARAFHHLAPAVHFDLWKQKREASLDRLADTVRASIDLPQLFAWVGLDYDRKQKDSEALKP